MSYFHIFKLIAADNSRNTETVADNADRGTEDDDDTTDTDYNPELTIITKYNHQHSNKKNNCLAFCGAAILGSVPPLYVNDRPSAGCCV